MSDAHSEEIISETEATDGLAASEPEALPDDDLIVAEALLLKLGDEIPNPVAQTEVGALYASLIGVRREACTRTSCSHSEPGAHRADPRSSSTGRDHDPHQVGLTRPCLQRANCGSASRRRRISRH